MFKLIVIFQIHQYAPMERTHVNVIVSCTNNYVRIATIKCIIYIIASYIQNILRLGNIRPYKTYEIIWKSR